MAWAVSRWIVLVSLMACVLLPIGLGCDRQETGAKAHQNASRPARPKASDEGRSISQPVARVPGLELSDESYRTKGVVRSIADDRRSVRVAHEEIPDYMKAMTMDFEVARPEMLGGIAAGDSIELVFREIERENGGVMIVALEKR